MISKEDVLNLLQEPESFRIEKTISVTNTDKFCEAICAFANDMPDSRKNGYLLIGVNDDGSLSGLKITDEIQKNIASIRTAGNILPQPNMTVQPFYFDGGDVLVVEVSPSYEPPVRYKGRTHIRIGPRKGIATLEEENTLTEKRQYFIRSYDVSPCRDASLDDIDSALFLNHYLPLAVSPELVQNDTRDIRDKMASLRLYDKTRDCPTNAAILLSRSICAVRPVRRG
jgi:ATP-dependent DNA helicase RecG